MRRIKTPDRRKSSATFPKVGNAKFIEAAEFLNCGRSTVYEMVKDERLTTVTVGKEKRIPWHVLWAYIGSPVLAESTS